jgi:hypothetical protein
MSSCAETDEIQYWKFNVGNSMLEIQYWKFNIEGGAQKPRATPQMPS